VEELDRKMKALEQKDAEIFNKRDATLKIIKDSQDNIVRDFIPSKVTMSSPAAVAAAAPKPTIMAQRDKEREDLLHEINSIKAMLQKN